MAREMFTSGLQLRPGRRVELEFGSRTAPRTVNHTTIADRAGCVEIEAHQNYAIGESRRSDDEYRLPPGGAVLVILGFVPLYMGGDPCAAVCNFSPMKYRA
jgi:hypothetical protein